MSTDSILSVPMLLSLTHIDFYIKIKLIAERNIHNEIRCIQKLKIKKIKKMVKS